MQELYATTFTLASVSDSSPFDLVVGRLADWSWERIGEAPDVQAEEPGEILRDDWRLSWWRTRDPSNDARAITMTLAHPDRRDASMRWHTIIEASHSHAFTRATIRLAREATTHVLRPGAFAMRPPAIVARLLDSPLHGYAGAIELRPIAHRLDAAGSADYITDVLSHPDRVLPVVVLAGDSVVPIPTSELARRLVGLAHVTVLAGPEAIESFGAALPEGMFVPPGGARIYWPGFGSTDDTLHHRYWTRSQLRQRPLDAELRRLLSRLSVGRVPVDPLPRRIQSSIARAMVERLGQEGRKARESAETSAQQSDQLDDLQRRYDALEEEAIEMLERNDALERELEASAGELRDVSSRLAVTEANLRATYAWQAPEEEPDGEPDAGEPDEPPDSWSEFADRISDLVTPGFRLTDRARDCAQQNAYPSPARMWEHLQKLAEAGDAYYASGGQVHNRFADWIIEQFGLDVALTDSTYTDTTFEYEGESLDRLPHVKIDDAVAPNEVGRIYFAIDGKRSRLVVDWFGAKRDRP